MSSDLNRIILIGRTTRDLELKYTPSGAAVAGFVIANNKSYTQSGEKKEQVSYFDCVVWSKLAEVMTEYVKKGTQIAIEGRLQQRRWDDADGNKKSKIEIIVETFQFVGGMKEKDVWSAEKENASTAGGGSVQSQFKGESVTDGENPFDDESIPF